MVRLLLFLACLPPLHAQRELSGAARVRLALDQLNTVGSVLTIAAHPDDENTALLAYFSRGRHLRTGYLSLTRGEGGQNLIGAEQGELLGVIRTQELLAARRVDGAEQFFTRAIDFGYSKTAEETLKMWGREQVLADIVLAIRRFRPDVIVLRFSGTSRDGHGHHQASALLGKEAFHAAADPGRFPEQRALAQPWQARRLLYNVIAFSPQQEKEASALPGRLVLDTGEYNAMLGCSYGEIAGMSRSLHQSQGMGAPERKGSQKNYLTLVAGEPAAEDPFDGIDLTWRRVPGAEAVAKALEEASRVFSPARPERAIPALLAARSAMAALAHPDAKRKLAEVEETIALAAGLWLDANASAPLVIPGQPVRVTLTALNRSRAAITLAGVRIDGAPARDIPAAALAYNVPVSHTFEWTLAANTPYSQPYWLARPRAGNLYAIGDPAWLERAENPPALAARFTLKIEGRTIELERPVEHRYVDRVRGELTRPIAIVPPVSFEFTEPTLFFPGDRPKTVEVHVRANMRGAKGTLTLETNAGWRVEPAAQPYALAEPGDQAVLRFEVTPPPHDSRSTLRAVGHTVRVIDYPHIPAQTVLLPAAADLVRAALHSRVKRVGYIMGAGDALPQMLRQAGLEVTLLDDDALARADLGAFDAIVSGIRAYNTRPALRANQRRLLEYIQQGGAYVVQYNVVERGPFRSDNSPLARVGPYPLTFGGGRVSVEDAPVRLLVPEHPLLRYPNRITPADFDGWVQERGLYFAATWDPRYTPLFALCDPGEPPLEGSTLYARYGKGAFVYTGFSFFRQLPAGNPGAFRLFVNLLNAAQEPR